MANFVARSQHPLGNSAHHQERDRDDRKAQPWRYIAVPKETVAKAVNHVEKRVEVAGALPKGWQRLYGVKNATQKCHGHNDKILKRGKLVEFLRPQSSDNPHRPHQTAAQDRKHQNPQRVRKMRLTVPTGHQ